MALDRRPSGGQGTRKARNWSRGERVPWTPAAASNHAGAGRQRERMPLAIPGPWPWPVNVTRGDVAVADQLTSLRPGCFSPGDVAGRGPGTLFRFRVIL